ncbi:Fe-S cluster assembly protein SufD [bacterium]|nr:Fe-S cluster assembly protein SufD [bacterium]
MEKTLENHIFSPAHLESINPGSPGDPAWLSELRRRGLDWFREMGFPTRRDEHWRFFKSGDVFKRDYAYEVAPAESIDENALAPYLFPGLDAHQLIFINGRLHEGLSDLKTIPDSLHLASLRESLHEEILPQKLGGLVEVDEHAPLALNTYLMQDGLCLRVPRNMELARPVHVLHLSMGADPVAVFPRNIICLEEGARASVLETYASLDKQAHFSVAATEVYCESGSQLDHYRLQRENESSTHIGWAGVHVNRDAHYESHEVSLGGAKLRRGTQVQLADPGAFCALNGLYLARGEQHMDHQTRVEHQSPDCRTEELYKGILDGKADAVFGGLILVEQDAQRTDALQSNRNLLLSEDAKVTSLPMLEIYADDVKCSHGSTTGQLDERQVFFLRSRGIGETQARAMLTFAFAREILEKMDLEPVRSRLSEELRQRLPY